MYVEASWPRKKGDVTKLRSPQFPMSGYNCQMQIAYHMRGYHIGTLAVEVQAEGGTEVRRSCDASYNQGLVSIFR